MVVLLAAVVLTIIPFSSNGAVRQFAFEPVREDVPVTFRNTAVVVEFIDQTQQDVGKGLSRVIWRELFGSVQDLPSSGVVLLTIEDDPELQQRIVEEYDYNVSRLAKEQSADFALWGVVREVEEEVLVWSYLAVSDDQRGPDLKMEVTVGGNEQYRIAAKIPQREFGFTPLQLNVGQLSDRLWLVRRSYNAHVYQSMDTESDPIGRLTEGEHVTSSRIVGKWLELKTPGEKERFVPIWSLDLVPDTVALGAGLRVREEPAYSSDVVQRVQSGYLADVRGMRFAGESEIKWFRVEHRGVSGWVPAGQVVTSQVLPGGYLVSATLRFQGGQYHRTIREVERFLEDGREDDNAILAFANQLRGAAALMNSVDSPANVHLAQRWFSKAIEQTPYDPAAYRLRAVSYAASAGNWGRALADLRAAVTHDRRSHETHRLIRALRGIVRNTIESGRYRAESDGPSLVEIEERLGVLEQRLLKPLSTEVPNTGDAAHSDPQ